MIQVDLGQETEIVAHRRASELAVSLEDYFVALVRKDEAGETQSRTLPDLDNFAKQMAEIGKGAPELSEYALSRESWYEDDRPGHGAR